MRKHAIVASTPAPGSAKYMPPRKCSPSLAEPAGGLLNAEVLIFAAGSRHFHSQASLTSRASIIKILQREEALIKERGHQVSLDDRPGRLGQYRKAFVEPPAGLSASRLYTLGAHDYVGTQHFR